MLTIQIPDEAFQLATTYELGEPIRIYRTEKRSHAKVLAGILAFASLVIFLIVLIENHFRFTAKTIVPSVIILAILLFVELLFFLPLLVVRRSTVYICSAGFILRRGRVDQVVRWEEVEWVRFNDDQCIIYLTDQRRIVLSRYIGDLVMLGGEIELKARLASRPEGKENLEIQFEHLYVRQKVRTEEKAAHLAGKRAITKETSDEVSSLREEYHLGEAIATFHAGFKGFMRKEAVGLPCYYLLILAFPVIFVGQLFLFGLLPGASFLSANAQTLYFILLVVSYFFFPRFSARFLRLHIYTEGFVLHDGSAFDVVRWEQVERMIYHKTASVLSSPLCHIYLKTGDTLTISGYIHERDTVRQILSEHVGAVVSLSHLP